MGNGTRATGLVCLRRTATSAMLLFCLSYHSYAVGRQSLSFFAPRRTDGHLFEDDAALESVAKKKRKNAHTDTGSPVLHTLGSRRLGRVEILATQNARVCTDEKSCLLVSNQREDLFSGTFGLRSCLSRIACGGPTLVHSSQQNATSVMMMRLSRMRNWCSLKGA